MSKKTTPRACRGTKKSPKNGPKTECELFDIARAAREASTAAIDAMHAKCTDVVFRAAQLFDKEFQIALCFEGFLPVLTTPVTQGSTRYAVQSVRLHKGVLELGVSLGSIGVRMPTVYVKAMELLIYATAADYDRLLACISAALDKHGLTLRGTSPTLHG